MMPILVESRRKKLETIKKLHPNSHIIDVTSKGNAMGEVQSILSTREHPDSILARKMC